MDGQPFLSVAHFSLLYYLVKQVIDTESNKTGVIARNMHGTKEHKKKRFSSAASYSFDAIRWQKRNGLIYNEAPPESCIRLFKDTTSKGR